MESKILLRRKDIAWHQNAKESSTIRRLGEIESPWRRFHLKFPSGKMVASRTKLDKESSWNVLKSGATAPFSRGRGQEVSRSLCPFFVAVPAGARWNQVSRGCVLPVPFTMATIVSVQRTFRGSAVEIADMRFRVRARVFARLRAVTARASASARAQQRRCTQVARRCAARHLPARFLR